MQLHPAPLFVLTKVYSPSTGALCNSDVVNVGQEAEPETKEVGGRPWLMGCNPVALCPGWRPGQAGFSRAMPISPGILPTLSYIPIAQ